MIDLNDITAVYFGNEAVTAVYAPDGTQIWPVGGSGGVYHLANIRLLYSSAYGTAIWASGLNYAFVLANVTDDQGNVVLTDVACTITAFTGDGFFLTTKDGRSALIAGNRGTTLGEAKTCTITAVSYSTTLNGVAISASASDLELTVTQEANTRIETTSSKYVGHINLGDWDKGSGGEEGDSGYAAWGPLEDGVADTCGFSYDAYTKITTFWKYTSGAEEITDVDYDIVTDLDSTNWRVTSDQSWCVISHNDGEASGEIRITEENTSGNRRYARLKLVHNNAEVDLEDENDDPVQVSVIQDIDQT